MTKPALIRQLLSFLTVAIAAMILPDVEAASTQIVTPGSRAEATAIIAEARRIVTPNGVERLEKVRIGGIDQWVSIRGADQRNPVLLVLHGGPGYVSMPLSWWFGRGWEEYFTVVHWDQRAAGKTHLITDAATIAPTLTIERMATDAEEMTAWVRRALGKEKIFMLGRDERVKKHVNELSHWHDSLLRLPLQGRVLSPKLHRQRPARRRGSRQSLLSPGTMPHGQRPLAFRVAGWGIKPRVLIIVCSGAPGGSPSPDQP